MGASGFIHLEVQAVRQAREKAIQVILADGSIHWLPRSVISEGDKYDGGDRDVTISVQEWFCEKEGIEQ
jgi:hypothetical protein